MTVAIILEFAVVLAAIFLGIRSGGVGLGLWGGVGVFVLTYGFGLAPTSPPIDVMLIILAVIMAASVMEAAGGIDYLAGIAERIIRRNPKQITFVAPVVCWLFTLGAGTGHIFYPLLPIIFQVVHENGIRPERPMAVATIGSQAAITASPVSAAMAAMIALYDPLGFGMPQIMLICMPGTLCGVLAAAFVMNFVGKELKEDPEYQRRLKAGEIQPPARDQASAERRELPPSAKVSAILFLLGVLFVVVSGLFPALRPHFADGDALKPMGMALTIEITMLALAALILLVTKTPAAKVPKTSVAEAGMTAIVGIFGLAWLGDTFIKGNEQVIIGGICCRD